MTDRLDRSVASLADVGIVRRVVATPYWPTKGNNYVAKLASVGADDKPTGPSRGRA